MPIHHSGGEDKHLPQRLTVPTHFHSRPNSLSPLIFPAGRRGPNRAEVLRPESTLYYSVDTHSCARGDCAVGDKLVKGFRRPGRKTAPFPCSSCSVSLPTPGRRCRSVSRVQRLILSCFSDMLCPAKEGKFECVILAWDLTHIIQVLKRISGAFRSSSA